MNHIENGLKWMWSEMNQNVKNNRVAKKKSDMNMGLVEWIGKRNDLFIITINNNINDI